MNEKDEVLHVSGNCEQCASAPTITAVRAGNRAQGLCLKCWKEYNSIMNDQYERQVRELNYNTALMDSMIGLPAGFSPRHELPPKRYQTLIGDYNLTNITIERSAVGVINTGTIAGSLENIDATIEIIKGDPKLQAIQDAVKKITEAVMHATDASQKQKEEILQLVSALADEVRAPKEKSRPMAINSLLRSISDTASAVLSIAKVWDLAKPLFDTLIK